MSFDPSDRDAGEPITAPSQVCVRDVSWHSQVCNFAFDSHSNMYSIDLSYQEPVLMSVAWQSGRGHSSVARHEWKGIGKLSGGMGKIEDHVDKQKLERAERAANRANRANRRGLNTPRMPGSYRWEEE